MALIDLSSSKPAPHDPTDGSLSPELTHDPTQGLGTTAWQRSVAMSQALNARERRN